MCAPDRDSDKVTFLNGVTNVPRQLGPRLPVRTFQAFTGDVELMADCLLSLGVIDGLDLAELHITQSVQSVSSGLFRFVAFH
jgi:hypothetical protein